MRDPNCQLCELCEHCHTTCLWGEGPVPAPLMLVGEAPGVSEDVQGRPFVGQAGKLLDHVLAKLGLGRGSLYITNVFKCRPKDNKLPAMGAQRVCWQACSKYLLEELRAVKPKAVVLMGATAVAHVASPGGPLAITALEGCEWASSSLELDPQPVWVAAFHPAYVLRSPSKEAHLARSIHRAAVAAGLRPEPVGESAGMFKYEVRS